MGDVVLRFSDLDAGTIVDDQFKTSAGVTISSGLADKPVMVFDTANPTGGDHDLETDNLGNVLIISEDGDSSDPDDNAPSKAEKPDNTINFDFTAPSTVKGFTALDNEEGIIVTLTFADGSTEEITVPKGVDNGQQEVLIDREGVTKMEVNLLGSGAIDNIAFSNKFAGDVGGDGLDGVVEGTDGDDVIDANYTGDPEGDCIDANDGTNGTVGDQDLVEAYDGDDTVIAGKAEDEVYGGDGDDTIEGNGGDDVLIGGDGADTIKGGAGDDFILGAGADRQVNGENLIKNGSFEDTSGMTDVAYGFVGEVPSWKLSEGTEADIHDDDRAGIEPTDGDNWLDLDASPGNIRIGQTVEEAAGIDQQFVLSFYAAEPCVGAQDNSFNVYWNGILLDTIDPPNGEMKLYTFSVKGTDGDCSGKLEFEALGDEDNIGASVDQVSLVCSPVDVTDDGASDTLKGGAGDDYIDGGQGADILDGGVGSDKVFGDDGDDVITNTDEAADFISGGSGADTVIGASVGDVIDGGDEGVDQDTLDLTGENARVVNVTKDVDDGEEGNGFDGTIEFLGEKGEVIGTAKFQNIEKIVGAICFTPGTRIATPKGEVPVEALREGDKVITRDNGLQEIRWIGRKELSYEDLVAAPELKPVLVKAGSLGRGLPERDIMLSPQHRVLMAGARTSLYFEETEVLAAAKHLIDGKGIRRAETLGTTYLHLLFDHHEIVLSDGAWTESFQPGDWSLGTVGAAQRKEILRLFPELAERDGLEGYGAARRSLKKHEAALLRG